MESFNGVAPIWSNTWLYRAIYFYQANDTGKVVYSQNMKSLLKEYADIMGMRANIEKRRNDLKAQILKGMADIQKTVLHTAHGNFIRVDVKDWQYTDIIILMEKQLKEAQEREKKEERATYNTRPILLFKPRGKIQGKNTEIQDLIQM